MPFGPAVETGTKLHRIEHACLALALAAFLGWIVFVARWTDGWRVLVWLVVPDLVFVPIAFGMRSRGGRWPRWGAPLYNAAHTYVSMLAGWIGASIIAGHVIWPMLAWALHLEIDRALGFDLRREE